VKRRSLIQTQEPNYDNHRHGKVNVKLETIEWWFSIAPEPTEDLEKAVMLLYQPKFKQWENWKKVEFKEANLRFSNSLLNREMIQVHKPIIDCPRNLINQAIEDALPIPNHITHQRVPSQISESFNKLRVNQLDIKMGILHQANLVQRDLTARNKVMPILTRVPAEFALHTYFINNRHFVLENVTFEKDAELEMLAKTV